MIVAIGIDLVAGPAEDPEIVISAEVCQREFDLAGAVLPPDGGGE